MSQQSSAVLERLLRTNGLGWLIDTDPPPTQATQVIPRVLQQLEKVDAEYRTRIGIPGPFSPEALEAESAQNPHKVRAFLQALRDSRSPQMLVMVWRILQGLSIRQVAMNYREQKEFSLTVILAPPGNALEAERYESKDIFDARLVRHFGIGTVCDQPLFDGFFPLRVN